MEPGAEGGWASGGGGVTTSWANTISVIYEATCELLMVQNESGATIDWLLMNLQHRAVGGWSDTEMQSGPRLSFHFNQ